MTKLQAAIFQTLAYADIFDYALTFEEIHKFLIGQKGEIRNTRYTIRKELEYLTSHVSPITYHDGFYYLKGREKIVSVRKKREGWSKEKIMIARRVAGWLKLIPTIKMVAVTGALAMENSEKEDDIDLLIVSSKNRLWLSRGLVVTILRLSRTYRRSDRVRDMICPNMLLDEEHLMVPKKEQDLFSAHEVYQLKPLWDRDNVYRKFIEANQWAKSYLPNWKENTSEVKPRHHLEDTSEVEPGRRLGGGAMDKLEILAMKPQLRYMAKRKTTEITESGRIRFHPQDAREWILKEYGERLNKLGIK